MAKAKRKTKKQRQRSRFQALVATLRAEGHSESSAKAIAAAECFKKYGKKACERRAQQAKRATKRHAEALGRAP